MARKSIMRGVSITPELLKEAKLRAESIDMGFSEYVQYLIKNDLRTKGAFVIEPAPEKRIKKESKKKSSK